MKVFFAGGEAKDVQETIIKIRHPYVLMSFEGLRKKKVDENFFRTYRDNGTKSIFLDSGGATYLYGTGAKSAAQAQTTFTDKDREEMFAKFDITPEEYIRRYIEWLSKWGTYVDAVAEFDLDRFFGYEQVLKWRQKLIDVVGKEKVVPVYHPTIPDGAFEEMCQNHPYVAIQGGLKMGDYLKLTQTAEKYGAKTHGFAMTKAEFMDRVPFYSVDSLSWKSGSMYGQVAIFNGRGLDTITKESRTKALAVGDKLGLPKEEVETWKGKALDLISAYAWLQYGNAVDKRSKKYWKDDDTDYSDSVLGDEAKPTGSTPQEQGDYYELLPEEEHDYATFEEIPEEMRYNEKGHLSELAVAIKERQLGRPLSRIEKYAPKHAGKIQKILKEDPTTEERRIQSVKRVNKLNHYNWKHGKFSQYRPIPDYVFEFLDKLDGADLNDPDTRKTIMDHIIKSNLARIEVQKMFEMADGGVQDKSLSSLLKDTFSMMAQRDEIAGNGGGKPPVPNNMQVNQFNFGNIAKELNEDDRTNALTVIRNALGKSPRDTSADK